MINLNYNGQNNNFIKNQNNNMNNQINLSAQGTKNTIPNFTQNDNLNLISSKSQQMPSLINMNFNRNFYIPQNMRNSHMNNNRVDYNVKSDYGGAIVNEGSVLIYNSTFANNYAKYAGAIYNKGTLSIVASDFSNNKGYSSKSNVDVYNQEAAVSIVSVKSYPSVTDHFPRPAWQQDLIETSITLAITLVTAGIAINAIIPSINITANNSINVNPFFI